MTAVLAGAAVWLLGSPAGAVIVGRAIRLAEARRVRP